MKEALLVIDMQNAFIHPNGSMQNHYLPNTSHFPGIRRAIEGCRAAIDLARLNQNPVIFTRTVYHDGYVDAGHFAPGEYLADSLAALRHAGGILAGTWDVEIVDELAPEDGDIVIDKTRFDAFLNTPLDPILRHLKVRRLTICGVITNFCVETTVRGAFVRDYIVTLLGDACAAYTEREHEISLESLAATGMATVVSTAGTSVGRS
jgi:ureidoacrylate peracid hydrolase